MIAGAIAFGIAFGLGFRLVGFPGRFRDFLDNVSAMGTDQ
jgi:hypothetical protein